MKADLDKIIKEIYAKEIFSRELFKVCELSKDLEKLIGEKDVYLSEFVIGKVLGLIKNLDGHQEIGSDMFLRIGSIINASKEVLIDSRRENTFLVLSETEYVVVVIKFKRLESGKTEIMTVYGIGEKEKKRLEQKHPVLTIA
jgi:hypothetical protein